MLHLCYTQRGKNKEKRTDNQAISNSLKYRKWDSNPHSPQRPGDFKSPVSTIPPFLHQEPRWFPNAKLATFSELTKFLFKKRYPAGEAGHPILPHRRHSLPKVIFICLWLFQLILAYHCRECRLQRGSSFLLRTCGLHPYLQL